MACKTKTSGVWVVKRLHFKSLAFFNTVAASPQLKEFLKHQHYVHAVKKMREKNILECKSTFFSEGRLKMDNIIQVIAVGMPFGDLKNITWIMLILGACRKGERE